MPSGLIEEKEGVSIRGNGSRYLLQMERHGLAVAEDEPGAFSLCRTVGSENIGGGGSLIARRRGARPAHCPSAVRTSRLQLLDEATGPGNRFSAIPAPERVNPP